MTGDEYADVRPMIELHRALRREFRLLPALVRGVPDADTGRAQILAEAFHSILDPFAVMAVAAAATRTAVIGTNVLNAPLVPTGVAGTIADNDRSDQRWTVGSRIRYGLVTG